MWRCRVAAPPVTRCSRLGFRFVFCFFWPTEEEREKRGFIFFMFLGQISACLLLGCKSALQTTATFLLRYPGLLINRMGITVTLVWQWISRRGDLWKSATEQNDANEKLFATLELSTAEQHPRLSDAPALLIQTWTVTPSLYVLWEAMGTEVNLTGQPPSLYPDQTDTQKQGHRQLVHVATEMTLRTTICKVEGNATYKLSLSSASTTEIKHKFVFYIPLENNYNQT